MPSAFVYIYHSIPIFLEMCCSQSKPKYSNRKETWGDKQDYNFSPIPAKLKLLCLLFSWMCLYD